MIGWYTNEYNDTYYYDENGRQLLGVQLIDGKSYYFEEWGMVKNSCKEIDGLLYYFGNNGDVTTKQSLATDGWKKMPNGWYYAINGKLCKGQWKDIGAYRYRFDYEGRMYSNEVVYEWDENDNYVLYRFDKNGHMVVGWYDEGGNLYYYGSDGASYSGIQVVDGVTYSFDEEGMVRTDWCEEKDGALWYFGKDGKLVKKVAITTDGWKQIQNGWYYVKNGVVAKNTWMDIGGYKYYFGYDGRMYADREMYDEDTWYRFDKNGHLVKGWYQEDYDRYYYAEDGKAVQGIQTIDGKTYYFYEDGRVGEYVSREENGYLYYFGNKGALIEKRSLSVDGWKNMPDGWYYSKNGKLLRNQFLTSGTKTYYLDGNGRMCTDESIEIYDEVEDKYYTYYFDRDGYMVKGWYVPPYGDERYYYDENGRRVVGLRVIDGETYYFHPWSGMLTDHSVCDSGYLYYFDKSGKMVSKVAVGADGWKKMPDGWYYIQYGDIVTFDWLKLDGKTYYFDEYGRMYADCIKNIYNDGDSYWYRFDASGAMVTGWYLGSNGYRYYYGTDGKAHEGLFSDNGVYYYCSSEGRIVTDYVFSVDGKLYYAAKNGVCTLMQNNGWIHDTYYVENGTLVKGWKAISGKWYYFDKDTGIKYEGYFFEIDGKTYYFDNQGVMKTGWIEYYDEQWAYAKSNGEVVENTWYQIGSNWYYSEDNTMVKGIVLIGKEYHLFNSNGVWIKQLLAGENGWINAAGTYYYLENGKLITDEMKIINGKMYAFWSDGSMVKDTMYYDYYFDESGAAVKNQWKRWADNTWYYFDENGHSVEGWKKLNNVWYYFDDGCMVTEDTIIDNTLYQFNKNGASNGQGISLKTGWNLIGGRYYYFSNGSLAKGWKDINGKTYYFSDSGKMFYGQMLHEDGKYYWFNANGSLAKGWSNNGDYYAEANGELVQGLYTIAGKQYCFENYYLIRNSAFLSEDHRVLYITGNDGAVVRTIQAKADGWVQDATGWYYVKNGVFATGSYLIGGKNYYFAFDGCMKANSYIYDTEMECEGYADASGEVLRNGWFENSYFRNGEELRGAQIIEGKHYYFGYGYESPSGLRFVDGAYYYYDGKGTRTKQNLKEGWNLIAGYWYYVQNGVLMKAQGEYSSLKINGTYYWFDDEGRMMTNQLLSMYMGNDEMQFMYLDANGHISTGWKVINNWKYYFDANGHALVGIHVIDGVTYNFAVDGSLIV